VKGAITTGRVSELDSGDSLVPNVDREDILGDVFLLLGLDLDALNGKSKVLDSQSHDLRQIKMRIKGRDGG